MEKARKRVNLAVKKKKKIFVLGVGGYVIKHNNMRARDINLFRNDGICTYLILESMCT